MKENVIKEKNVKIPLYVTVYETISEWLKEGKYKPGDKLPGENILAEQLNVSRGTLRQAMLLQSAGKRKYCTFRPASGKSRAGKDRKSAGGFLPAASR